ncbi:MAG: beta strand repeat-containing protein, partial [Achromobacter pestifer]
YATDGTPLAAGLANPSLVNTLHGVFGDARLNGGLGSTLIDASAFSGNTALVSGLMAGGVIKSGSGANTKHQVLLLGGRYAVTGGTGANATTELVVAADGLTGIDGADYVTQTAASGGVGYVSFEQTGGTTWIKRAAGETLATASTYTGITSARVVSGEYGNWIDTSRFAGQAVLDGAAGLSNYFVISNAYATQVIGSAGTNTIELSTGGKNVTLDNSQVKISQGGVNINSAFTNVNDFRFVVQGGSANVVDTRAFTGVTTQTYLSDLTTGYTPAEGPALAFLFPNKGNARVDVGLEGVRTIQDLLDAISAGIMVDAAGVPLRVAVGGPNAGKLIPSTDTTTAWDYLYALTASLDAQGRLQVTYSQDAIAAGFTGAFALAPGMQAALNADGTVSNSTVSLSDAAYQLGLIAAGQMQSSSTGAGVLTGAVLAIGHQTQFVLAGANSTINSGGGDNTFVVNYGQQTLNTGSGNAINALAGARNSLVVNTSLGAVLSNGSVSYVDSGGASTASVSYAAGSLTDATVIATNTSGSTTLDATAWTKPVTLATSGGYDTLKGNTNQVSFVVTQPADTSAGTVTVSLASNSGTGNSVQVMALGAGTDLSRLISSTGTLAGVTLGANTDKLDYVLDIGDGTLDQALTVTGRNVIIRGQSYSVLQNITLDAGYA